MGVRVGGPSSRFFLGALAIGNRVTTAESPDPTRRRKELRGAVANADGKDLHEVLGDVSAMAGVEDSFESIDEACQMFVDDSFLRDGPRPCSVGG